MRGDRSVCGCCRRKVVMLSLMGTAIVVASVLLAHQWWDAHKLAVLVAQWEGFGSERGHYDFTVVTGLFDIGRGHWLFQGRSYNTYLGWFLEILKLDVNLVVFIEPKAADFVRHARRGREERTVVIEMEISDLRFYSHLERVREVMESKDFQHNNEIWRKGLVEAKWPLYNVVTNSKAMLMREAIRRNPFRSSFWIWMDAGLTHGKSLFPPDGVWHPRHLLSVPDRVTFTALKYPMEHWVNMTDIHKHDVAPVAGGLYAGGTKAMLRYTQLHEQVWKEMLQNNIVDDDQTTFTLAYFKDPSNFNPIVGDWFTLVKPWT